MANNNDYVFVVDRKGKPLMPTKRRGRVRHLLKEGKAVVIKTHPFTIKMKYDAGHYKKAAEKANGFNRWMNRQKAR